MTYNFNERDLTIELAKIWLKGQDLTQKTPTEVKEMFFKSLYEVEQANVERWG